MQFLNVERSTDLILNVSSLETSFRSGRYCIFLLWSSCAWCVLVTVCCLPVPVNCAWFFISWWNCLFLLLIQLRSAGDRLAGPWWFLGLGFFEWGHNGRKDMKYIWCGSRCKWAWGWSPGFLDCSLSGIRKFHRTDNCYCILRQDVLQVYTSMS